jgi:hypothetical protein
VAGAAGPFAVAGAEADEGGLHGGEIGLAWADSRNGNGEIYFVRLSSTGKPRGQELRVSVDAGDSTLPAIAWTGTAYGLAWSDDQGGNDGIYFVRVGCL